MLDGMFSFVLLDTSDNSFIIARDAIGITFLNIGWSLDASVWIASELKGLNDDCEHFESFAPGHLYSSKEGALKRWYNPAWFSEAIPSAPYDPLALRSAFEIAVIKRLMTDVPLRVLLSRGMDSSLVASITTHHLAGMKAAKQWGALLHSFCVRLEALTVTAHRLALLGKQRKKHRCNHLQQLRLEDKVLCMTIMFILTRICHQTTEPLWKKISNSCSCVCNKRNLCAICSRAQWAKHQVLNHLDIGISLSRKHAMALNL